MSSMYYPVSSACCPSARCHLPMLATAVSYWSPVSCQQMCQRTMQCHQCTIRCHQCTIQCHQCTIQCHQCAVQCHQCAVQCTIQCHQCAVQCHQCTIQCHQCVVQCHQCAVPVSSVLSSVISVLFQCHQCAVQCHQCAVPVSSVYCPSVISVLSSVISVLSSVISVVSSVYCPVSSVCCHQCTVQCHQCAVPVSSVCCPSVISVLSQCVLSSPSAGHSYFLLIHSELPANVSVCYPVSPVCCLVSSVLPVYYLMSSVCCPSVISVLSQCVLSSPSAGHSYFLLIHSELPANVSVCYPVSPVCCLVSSVSPVYYPMSSVCCPSVISVLSQCMLSSPSAGHSCFLLIPSELPADVNRAA